MGTDKKREFAREQSQMVEKHLKKCSLPFAIREMQIFLFSNPTSLPPVFCADGICLLLLGDWYEITVTQILSYQHLKMLTTFCTMAYGLIIIFVHSLKDINHNI